MPQSWSASHTGVVHCLPDQPASHTQGNTGSVQAPWTPQAGVHTAPSQRVPVHPGEHAQVLALAHTPWTQPREQRADWQAAPVHPEPQVHTPGEVHTPWTHDGEQMPRLQSGAPSQPVWQAQWLGPSQTPWMQVKLPPQMGVAQSKPDQPAGHPQTPGDVHCEPWRHTWLHKAWAQCVPFHPNSQLHAPGATQAPWEQPPPEQTGVAHVEPT